jgi:hypothetical protein
MAQAFLDLFPQILFQFVCQTSASVRNPNSQHAFLLELSFGVDDDGGTRME